jgi:hypothetical protein
MPPMTERAIVTHRELDAHHDDMLRLASEIDRSRAEFTALMWRLLTPACPDSGDDVDDCHCIDVRDYDARDAADDVYQQALDERD